MKGFLKLSFLFFSLIITVSYAGEISFQGPCDKAPFLKAPFNGPWTNLGKLTIQTLEENSISYIGTEQGINSIEDSPVDKEAIEILGPGHLRAYGWCFHLNGELFPKLPHQIRLSGSENIHWFYAYSTFKDGKRLNYCLPSSAINSDFLCPK